MPLALLALSEEEPRKAYEFIAELDRRFGPTYRSSPGGIYPALTALTRERLLKTEADGRARRYRLTSRGREALDRRRSQLAALETRTGARLRADASLRPVLDRFTERAMKFSGYADPAMVESVLDEAWRRIEELKGGADGLER
ncbi:MAG: PadR family transcriptional regulator [Actinomycetota bacterium]